MSGHQRAVWFHLPDMRAARAAENLAYRIDASLPDAHICTTLIPWAGAERPAQSTPSNASTPPSASSMPPSSIAADMPALSERLAPQPAPRDRRWDAQVFFNTQSVAAGVIWGGALPQQMIAEAEALRIPLFLVGAGAGQFEVGRMPWHKMRMRSCLRRFRRILVETEEAAERLRSLGARPWIVEVAGQLEEASPVPRHSEADRADLADSLATRPVWYAVDCPLAEIDTLLSAHEAALRRAHRFLMVVSPANLADSDAMEARVQAAGMRVARRSTVDRVDRELQVLIVDVPDEHGLWYRLSPLSVMGGTLSGAPNRDPFEAAALGSAVIFGPRIARFGANFERLRVARAARAVSLGAKVVDDLGATLASLSTPDRSAAMANRAWEVTSHGAEATDRVVELISAELQEFA